MKRLVKENEDLKAELSALDESLKLLGQTMTDNDDPSFDKELSQKKNLELLRLKVSFKVN